MNEWNLSDKRRTVLLKLLEAYLDGEQADIILRLVSDQDREFIRRLKDKIKKLNRNEELELGYTDELAGEALVHSQADKKEDSVQMEKDKDEGCLTDKFKIICKKCHSENIIMGIYGDAIVTSCIDCKNMFRIFQDGGEE